MNTTVKSRYHELSIRVLDIQIERRKTIREIAGEMGVSDSTLYRFIESAKVDSNKNVSITTFGKIEAWVKFNSGPLHALHTANDVSDITPRTLCYMYSYIIKKRSDLPEYILEMMNHVIESGFENIKNQISAIEIVYQKENANKPVVIDHLEIIMDQDRSTNCV